MRTEMPKVSLNKKQIELLSSQKCEVQKVTAQLGKGSENRYLILMSFTRHEIAALDRALEGRVQQGDDFVDDVYTFLRNAMERGEIKDKDGNFR